MKFGYIANGKLYLAHNGQRATEVQSEFALQVLRRHEKAQEKSQWKSGGGGDGMMGYDLWNQKGGMAQHEVVRIQSAAAIPSSSEVFYSLRTETVGGLFRYDYVGKEEVRIFHKEDVDIYDLNLNGDGTRLLCSAKDGEGRSIALLGTKRYKLDFITEGDAFDVAPSWVPGEDAIVFQSSGIGRNQSGRMVKLANATVEKVDLSSGACETLLEDPRFDYLNPKVDAQGNLYCIRRPYLEAGRYVSQLDLLKDFLMMPFRLLKALFGFLDMMTRVFGQQTLSNAATGTGKEVDLKEAYIKGAYLNLSKVNREAEHASLIPADWELIKVTPAGEVSVLKQKVMDYELSASGEVVYTNGFAVHVSNASASDDRLFKGREVIDRVFAL